MIVTTYYYQLLQTQRLLGSVSDSQNAGGGYERP